MSKNTVFVIGAGASHEVNLPIGEGLKDKISTLLDIRINQSGTQESGSSDIVKALRLSARSPDGHKLDIQPYLNSALHIRDALPLAISIDNFIDSQRGDEKIILCAKLAIVKAILQAEADSDLSFESIDDSSSVDFKKIENTWFIPLFKLLSENCCKEDLRERFKNITFIIFNYDRCVEHFLYHALQTYYKMSEDNASELIKSLSIFHPYGVVGNLPWYNNQNAIDFGSKLHPQTLLDLSKNIRTFTEGTDPNSSDIVSIREQIGAVNRLVFLGFAFHPLNMEILNPKEHFKEGSQIHCYGTAYKISASDLDDIEDSLKNLFRPNVSIGMYSNKCIELFDTFWRSLSFCW